MGVQNLRSDTANMLTIYTDIAGPITPTSREGQKYVISFREKKTNISYTISIKDLTQVPTAIQQYIIAMNNDILSIPIVPQLTILHSDSATVYLSAESKKVLSNHGIITAASTSYYPTSNSVAERGWRTEFDLARTLLSEATKLSGFINNTFWSQAIQHATLIINLTTLGHGSINKSAFEMILNKSPTIILSKLLPFGCPGVMKIESHRET